MGLDGERDPQVDRYQHTDLAASDMNTTTILDLIATRHSAVAAAANDLREQIAKLTGELAEVEAELADLQITRQTLKKITHNELTAAAPTISSEPYQQIIAVFDPDGPGLRARDVCTALGLGVTPKDTEGLRAKLKRLVARQVLTEPEPGLFALNQKRT
ncbi:hypothetical protein GCM10009681_56820 [Luedemannella helvata]|uniref:Uncharacterized protein n=1 Tax=Luedemannella helvata TaxID=349315 RepID=A0ABN2L8K4_9ACTN